jgi:hypothetical protein
MAKSAITETFGVEEGTWVLCMHCERCYRVGEHRMGKDGREYCHYEGCDGDAVMDAWRWSHVRKNHKGYPRVPVRGIPGGAKG